MVLHVFSKSRSIFVQKILFSQICDFAGWERKKELTNRHTRIDGLERREVVVWRVWERRGFGGLVVVGEEGEERLINRDFFVGSDALWRSRNLHFACRQ